MWNRSLLILFALSAILVGCSRSVYLSVLAIGGEYRGSVVKLDGRIVGQLRCAPPQTSTPYAIQDWTCEIDFRVPFGSHELRIEKAGYQPIIKQLYYDGQFGEDYVDLEPEDLKPVTKATSGAGGSG